MAKIGSIISNDDSATHYANGILQLSTAPGSSSAIAGALDLTAGTVGRFAATDIVAPLPYEIHLLSKWEIKAHVYNLSAGGAIGFGIYDKIREAVISPPASAPPRHVWITVDRAANLLYLSVYEGFSPAFTCPISPGFNYADFTFRAKYDNCYLAVVLQDTAGRVVTMRYRWDLRSFQGPAPGNFAFKMRTETASLGTIGVSSDHKIGADYVFMGDSIMRTRKVYPESLGFAGFVETSFINAGILTKSIETWASGSMAVHTELLFLTTSIIAAAPLNLVICMGDNDPPAVSAGDINNITTWAGMYGKFLSDLRAAGIIVWVISMTPEIPAATDHSPQHIYIETQLNIDLNTKYGVTVNTINVWDALYGNLAMYVDYVHLAILGLATGGAIIHSRLTA